MTDHIPISMSVNVEHILVLSRNGNSINTKKWDWSTFTKKDILSSYAHTDKPLSNIYLPRDAITCSDVNCKDVKHANIYASCIMV